MLNTHSYRIVLQGTRGNSVERGQRSPERSWTYWKLCSRRHAIQTYSCVRRSPWKSTCRNHGFRYEYDSCDTETLLFNF